MMDTFPIEDLYGEVVDKTPYSSSIGKGVSISRVIQNVLACGILTTFPIEDLYREKW